MVGSQNFAQRRQEAAQRFAKLRATRPVEAAAGRAGSGGKGNNKATIVANKQFGQQKLQEFRQRNTKAIAGGSSGGGKPPIVRKAANDNNPYPSNFGFQGKAVPTTLKAGTVIDRYGSLNGKFSSPVGTTFEQRSLSATMKSAQYRKFEVIKPLNVMSGKVAPWYGKSNGGGTQYMSTMSFKELIRKGYIREVK